MHKLLVIVPSRLKTRPDGKLFLEGAIGAIFNQTLAKNRALEIEVAIGIDKGAEPPVVATLPPGIQFFVAEGASQAAALNAAAKPLDHDYLAILEDDDEWHEAFLAHAIEALTKVDFISSTQLQVDTKGEIACIVDFPTPSGWVMHRRSWEAVGPFDEAYRFHLDNDWLGRLAEAGLRRLHLIEATAPVDLEMLASLRPQLHAVITQGGPRSGLLRHQFAVPLVWRLMHDGSGTHATRADALASARSAAEKERLHQRYGRLPW